MNIKTIFAFFLLVFSINTQQAQACSPHDYHKCAHGIDTTPVTNLNKCPNGICAELSWKNGADLDLHAQLPTGLGIGPYVGSNTEAGPSRNSPFTSSPERHIGWQQRTVNFAGGQATASLDHDNRTGVVDDPLTNRRIENLNITGNIPTEQYRFAGHNYNQRNLIDASANYTFDISTDGKGFVVSNNHLSHYQEKGLLARQGDQTQTYIVNYVNNGFDPHALGTELKLNTTLRDNYQEQLQHNREKYHSTKNQAYDLSKKIDQLGGLDWKKLETNKEWEKYDKNTQILAYNTALKSQIERDALIAKKKADEKKKLYAKEEAKRRKLNQLQAEKARLNSELRTVNKQNSLLKPNIYRTYIAGTEEIKTIDGVVVYISPKLTKILLNEGFDLSNGKIVRTIYDGEFSISTDFLANQPATETSIALNKPVSTKEVGRQIQDLQSNIKQNKQTTFKTKKIALNDKENSSLDKKRQKYVNSVQNIVPEVDDLKNQTNTDTEICTGKGTTLNTRCVVNSVRPPTKEEKISTLREVRELILDKLTSRQAKECIDGKSVSCVTLAISSLVQSGADFVFFDAAISAEDCAINPNTLSCIQIATAVLKPLKVFKNSKFLKTFDKTKNLKKLKPVTKLFSGLSPKLAKKALSNIDRVKHASVHLKALGLIKASANSPAAIKEFKIMAYETLTNPIKVFDHVMTRGKQVVTGYYGRVKGRDVIFYIAKEPSGSIKKGEIVTAIEPTIQQLKNFGL